MKKSIFVLLHAAYWFAYSVLIGFIIAFSPAWSHNPALHSLPAFVHIIFYSHVTVFALLPGVLGFYLFYGIGFGRFFRQKRLAALTTFAVSVCLVISLLTVAMLGFFFLLRLFKDNGPAEISKMVAFLFFLTLIHGVLGLIMKGFVVSYGDIRIKEELNKKNYETELALLKSQINPHFLFNTLNNIDVLIGKDAIKASEYLNKLSDIMRFMLYETKTDKIELSKELAYIQKYIDLQKIRTTNPDYIHYSVEGDPGSFLIEPMLFIPFIENAFKHADSKKNGNAIKIRVAITGNQVLFDSENSYSENSYSENTYNENSYGGNTGRRTGQEGLGNRLIQKRLALLYPSRHTLEMNGHHGIYKVKLALTR